MLEAKRNQAFPPPCRKLIMNSLDIANFRRAELVLISLIGVSAAETVSAAMALCADLPVPDPRALNDLEIATTDVAARLGVTIEAAADRLKLANACFESAFGISMLTTTELDPFADWARTSLDADFVDVVRGISINDLPRLPSNPKPDAVSLSWIELVIGAAVSKSPAPFLYRCARQVADCADEMSNVAAALVARAPDDAVAVLCSADRSLPPSALALSALLTTPASIFIVDRNISLPPPKRTDSDTDFDVGESANDEVESLTRWTVAGERLLALAAVAPLVTLIPVESKARFAPKTLEPVVGAVGPLAFDRAEAIAAVKTLARWELSDAVAGRIVSLFPDLFLSRRILEMAARLPITFDKTSRLDRRQRAAAARNDLTSRLVNGIGPHLATSYDSRGRSETEPFYRELVCCAHHGELLLDPANGERLRRAGVRISLHGVAGTGKSELAKAIARDVLKCESLHVRASDILAHKLGVLERNLAATFDRARERNAVLIFDEVDSLASSRANAGSASYIISLTNSLLVEIDAHSLPIITTTNHFERIDPAIRRRYDISTEVLPIADEIEPKAFELILGLKGHVEALGHTCVADYAYARKMATLTGDGSLDAAIAAVRAARDIRIGKNKIAQIGFI